MPWTVEDVDSHKAGLSDKKKKQWVRVANSVLKRCMAKGGDEKTCAASAIKQANGVVNNNAGEYTVYKNDSTGDYDVKIVEHLSKVYYVIPVTMMVEGVHNGNHGKLLHTMEELGKFPESWNGRPIVINHPEIGGVAVSASSPEIMEHAVGVVYNTKVDGNKLVGEAWLDEDKLNDNSPETLEDIEQGKIKEVSVGVFTDEKEEVGIYNDEEYEAVAFNHRPDHLAILTECQGACSVEDGCGLGVNDDLENNEKVTGFEKKRADLKMSVSEFYAVPRDPPSSSKLPIFDAAHVRNAMARFSQTQGLSAKEKASAKRKILAKAKKFKIDASGFSDANKNELMDMMAYFTIDGYALHKILENAKTKEDAMSFDDIRSMMYDKLRSMEVPDVDGRVRIYYYIQELYPTYVIYAKEGDNSNVLYKQSYKIESGKVEFEGNAVMVERKVDYIEVNENKSVFKKEVKMAKNDCPECLKKVDALIANKDSKFEEADREWLLDQDEATLDKLAPVIVEKTVEKTVEVNKLSDEDKAALAFGRKQLKERRDGMIKTIQANTEKDLWSEEVLGKMDDETLERVFKSVKKEEEVSVIGDYSLFGAGRQTTDSEEVEPLLLAQYEKVEEPKK